MRRTVLGLMIGVGASIILGCGRGNDEGTPTFIPLVITTPSPLPDAVRGQAYLLQLLASGGVKPYRWTVDGLPRGMQMSSEGLISGVPLEEVTVKEVHVQAFGAER